MRSILKILTVFLAVAVAIPMISSCRPTETPQEAAQSSIRNGDLHRRDGNMRQAFLFYRQATQQDPTVLRGWWGQGIALMRSNKPEEALAPLEEYLKRARQQGNKDTIADALNVLGTNAIALGDYKRAGMLLDDAIAMIRKTGDLNHLGHVQADKARLLYKSGDVSGGLKQEQAALDNIRKGGDGHLLAVKMSELGNGHFDARRNERALALLTQSRTQYESLLPGLKVAPVKIAMLSGRLGLVHARMKNYALAIPEYEKAVEFYEGFSFPKAKSRLASQLNNLGVSYLSLGQHDHALTALRRSVALEEELGHGHTGAGLANIALALKGRGDLKGACDHWRKAAKAYREKNVMPIVESLQKRARDNGCTTFSSS